MLSDNNNNNNNNNNDYDTYPIPLLSVLWHGRCGVLISAITETVHLSICRAEELVKRNNSIGDQRCPDTDVYCIRPQRYWPA